MQSRPSPTPRRFEPGGRRELLAGPSEPRLPSRRAHGPGPERVMSAQSRPLSLGTHECRCSSSVRSQAGQQVGWEAHSGARGTHAGDVDHWVWVEAE